MKPERLEHIRRHYTGGVPAELLEEIDRLRAALAVVADPTNWGKFQYQEATFKVWRGTGEYADPIKWAAGVRDSVTIESN